MRREIKIAGVALLTGAMLLNTLPVMATAKSKTEKEQQIEGDYKKGEAVVMYYGTEQGIRDKGAALFGPDIIVEDTWNFTDKENSYGISGHGEKAQLLVSKVRSKKKSTKEMIATLEKQKNVKYAEPNYIYHATDLDTTASYAPYQWGLENNGQNAGTTGDDIKVANAWAKKKSTKKVVAVVDSGVDYKQKDLADNMWVNPYKNVLHGIHGYDFVNDDDDPADDNQHGTHCAGIIAGEGTYVTGVTPQAKIMALKWLDSTGHGELSNAVAAYDYINRAIDLGTEVVAINNSWGGNGSSKIFQSLVDMVGKKGAISVAAAGNDTTDCDVDKGDSWDFNSEYVIRVAATNENDEIATFSNYGKGTIDIAAPGTDILSCVNTNVYNPSIHKTDPGYSEVLKTFENKKDEAEFKSNDPSAIKISSAKGQGFGEVGSSAMSVKVDVQDTDRKYIVYLPVALPESSTVYRVSAMVKLSGPKSDTNSGIHIGFESIDSIKEGASDITQSSIGSIGQEYNSNYWDRIGGDSYLSGVNEEEQFGLWIALTPSEKGQYELLLDDIGISKQNLTDEELGSYDFLSGTSMAAPYVTGAVALASELYEGKAPEEIRDTIAASARRFNDPSGKQVKTGVLDLSKLQSQLPIIKDVKVSKDQIVINGRYFESKPGSVTVGKAKAKLLSWEENRIVIAAGEFLNKEARIQVETEKKETAEIKTYLSYNETDIEEVATSDQVTADLSGTDGNHFYCLDTNGAFSVYREDEGCFESLEPLTQNAIDRDAQNTRIAYFIYESQLVYANHAFYVNVTGDAGYYSIHAIAKYDMETNTWSKLCDLPSNLEYMTLASYQGKLYEIGGYDRENDETVGEIYSYDLENENGSLVKEKAEIPKRFAGVAEVAGDKLVVALGGTGETDDDIIDEDRVVMPNIVVYDGVTWKEIKGTALEAEYAGTIVSSKVEPIPYYSAQVGVYKDGLLYANLYTEKYGNVLTYNVKNNSYKKYPCSLYEYTKDSTPMTGRTVGDQFYLFTGTVEGGDGNVIVDPEDMQTEFSLYSFPIATGYYKVTGEEEDLDGCGYYYPGSKITLCPKEKEGQEVSSFKVNGREVLSDAYTIPKIDRDYNVEVTYVPTVNQLTLTKTKLSMKAGEQARLRAAVTPEGTTITWNTSDKRIATVTNGTVKAVKSGVVTITATAGRRKASCTVTVRPQDVTGLKAKAGEDRVTLSWKKVKGCDGYRIYTYTGKNKKETMLCEVKGEKAVSVVLKKLRPATEYTYKVAAYKKQGNKVIEGSKSKSTITTKSPATKISSIKKLSKSKVKLNWTKTQNISGYEVIMSTDKSKGYRLVAKANSKNVSIKQSGLKRGKTYYFKVRTFTKIGKKTVYGDYSKICSIRM